MKILFAGSPDIAVPALNALCDNFEVGAVLTACDKRGKRGKKMVPTAVKQAALERGLPVLEFDHLRTEAREAVKATGCDFLVCFAFGRIFGPRFLSLFEKGSVNIHPSLLPRFRGPSPIQAALLAGVKETGITVQKIAKGMDEGDIASQITIPLEGNETTPVLESRVAALAAEQIVATLSKPLEFTAQKGEPSYCSLIKKEDGRVDWSRPASEIDRMVRAFYPWPKVEAAMDSETVYLCGSAGCEDSDSGEAPGTVLGFVKKRGLKVQCGEGCIYLSALQRKSRKEMDAASFVNGNRQVLTSVLS